MAAMGNQEASGFTSRCTYHVFLSSRGEDTRNFTDHLCTALVGAGFRTYRDDDEIGRGEIIKAELQKAIQQSKLSIIVFSKDYVSSGWCLDKLVMILEHKRTSRHVALPVFYDVDPSQVRKQTGGIAKVFSRHEERANDAETEERKNELKDKVKEWKAALREVADLAGMVLQNQSDGHDSKFIQKIVKVVTDKLSRTALNVAPYIIGIESRVKNINLWIRDGSTDVDFVVIWGMGGIGKTTIAKYSYNLNFELFEGSSFLANIREISGQPDGLIRLQRQLLSNIVKRKKEKIFSVDEGTIKIKDALCCKRVLLVLDDVDHPDQLDAILGMRDWLYAGSKVIITTRKKQLLKAHESYKVHEVEKLNNEESYELFSWHTFGQDHPIEGFMDYSTRVVYYSGGLPLALQVLGSSLSGRGMDVWESALEKLKAIPESQILTKLKISYDSLQDAHDKNLFLDIACFFVGKDRDCSITILDGCDFFAKIGIHNLIDRCLLTIDHDNKLVMHQLLQEMGKEIIQQESPKEPGKRSRLWHNKDASKVLRERTGTETIEGLTLNLHVSKENKPVETCFSENKSKRRHSEDFLDKSKLLFEGNSSKRRRLGFFPWLPINSNSMKLFSTSDEIDLQTAAFSRMHKLRILHLNNVWLTGGYKEFPELKWLCWHGYPLGTIPSDFPLESMVALDMRYSSLEKVWKRTELLRLLRILNLSHSQGLNNTLDFSVVPNLERLILKHCVNLIEVHESIGELGRLILLNLKGCKNLRKLPRKIGQLKSLEKLILSGCSKLEELPAELGEMEFLTVLQADGTAINQVSCCTTSEVKSWRSRLWSWVVKPRKIPDSIDYSFASLPRSLVSLSLAKCNLSDDSLPRNLGSLSLLKDLCLSGNPFCSIPENIKGLNMLRYLEIDSCELLQSLPELPQTLMFLGVGQCRSLRTITNLPNLLGSLVFDSNQCVELVEVQGLFKLEPIGNFDTDMINNLGLVELESLGSLEVKLCNRLASSTTKGPLQGLYEFGIFSIFLPGSEVPSWFSNKSSESSISFSVPSLPNLKIRNLNVCVVFSLSDTAEGLMSSNSILYDEYIKVTNETKALKWTYSPTVICIPDFGKDTIWLSSWKMANQLIKSGDQVNVSVGLWGTVWIKEFGIHVVYEEEGTQDNTYPSHQEVLDSGDWSAYEVRTGSYFLCHHDMGIRQGYAMDIGSMWDGVLFGER